MKNVYYNYIVQCFAFNDENIVKWIEKIVDRNFGDDIVIAVTHSFNVSIKSDYSYQRIEFLGDKQMGCLVSISQYLIKTFIEFDEERLSHTRAAIVCYHYLSRRVVRRFDKYDYCICKYISMQSREVRSKFLQYINSLNKTIDGFEFCMLLLIATKEKQPFCPKISGDVLEAIRVAIMRIQWNIIKSDFLINDKQITPLEAFKTMVECSYLLQQARRNSWKSRRTKQQAGFFHQKQ